MRSKIAPIFWVVLFFAVPAGLYYLYVVAQLQHITEMNQRELGRAAENLKEILRNGVQTVKNLSTTASYTCTFSERQPYLDLADGLECSAFTKEKPRDESDIDVEVGENGLRLVAADVVDANHRSLAFDFRLEKALDELVVTDGFEYLFLARGDGTVLFQTRRGERKRWLDQLRWFDRHARDESVPVSSALRLQKVSELQTGAGPVAFENFARTSNSVAVQIGGTGYRLHVQPLLSISQLQFEKHTKKKIEKNTKGHETPSPKPGEKPEANNLVLGGLVSENASSGDARAIEPLYALALALLVGVGVLSWPLVKFFVLSPQERFKFLDFTLLILSTSAMLGFLTILFLDAEAYRRLKSLGESRLKILANKLQDDFICEISNMRQQLMDFEKRALETDNAFNCDALLQGRRLLDPALRADLFGDCHQVRQDRLLLDPADDSTETDRYFKVGPDAAYPNFTSVFWARGKDGFQIGKLTTNDANTSRVKVASRNYFSEVQSGHVWELASEAKARELGSKDGPRGFFLQTYRSITTGDFETGLSMRSRLKVCNRRRGEPNVAVLTTLLWSFRARPLPPDLGFMVIDRSGRVLYHSDERRALREDLFEEITNSRSLRAIVLNQWPEALTTSYRGAPHQFWVQPIEKVQIKRHPKQPDGPEKIGWFLVAFQDLELSRTVNSEAMISVLVWGLFYFLIVQFIPAAIFVWKGPMQMAWLWPSRQKAGLYARLSVALAAVSVVGVVYLMLATGWALMAGSCTIGAVGVIVAISEYLRWRRCQQDDPSEPDAKLASPRRIGWCRVAAGTLLLIVVSVLPAAGLFKFSWNQEIGAFLRYEKDHIQQTRDDLRNELDERARDLFIRAYGPYWRCLTQTVFKAQIDAITNPVIPGFNLDPHDAPADVLAGLKPVYNDASAQLRYRRASPLPAKAHLQSTLGWFAAPSCAALVCLLVFWIRYAAKRLLLTDVTDRKSSVTSVLEAIKKVRNSNQNQILVVSSAAQEQAVREELGLQVRKVRAVAAGAEIVGTTSNQGLSLTEALCEADSRRTALKDVETLAAAGGAVIFSRVDPVEYCVGRALSATDPSFTPAEHRRWADVLEHFSVVRVPLADENPAGKEDSDALYWSIWDSCTDLEKLVLLHVAEEGFANPREHRTVRDLLHRGLLVLRPELSVFSSRFHHFLRQVRDSELVKQLEKPGRFGWSQTKWALTVIVVGIVVFLGSTQRQSLAPVVTLVATLTGAVSGILKLVADFSPKQR